MSKQLLINTDAYFENGSFRELPVFIKNKGYSNPAIIVDEGFAKSDLFKNVEFKLKKEFDDVFIYICQGSQEPTYDDLSKVLIEFRNLNLDLLVGIGGGSTMDISKAVGALLTNKGNPLKYKGFDKLLKPGKPTLLIPTTAGTGSEVSFNASFVDYNEKKKMGINGRYMFATYAMIDGETTLSCPYKASLSAGVDALVHCLEGFVCKNANPRSDIFAREGIRLIANSILCLKNDPDNINKRLDLLTGAFYGGIVQMNSGSGVAAALSYPLSVYYKVPHGIGGGMFAVDMIRYNIDGGYLKYSELASMLDIDTIKMTDKEKAEEVYNYFVGLWNDLEVPSNLSEFGINKDQFNHVIQIMNTQQPAFDQNPISFTVKENVESMIKKFF